MARSHRSKSRSGRSSSAVRRDAAGRFAGRKVRRRKSGRLQRGRRGPSYWANKTVLEIARRLVVVESEVGRLEAEYEGREWRDAEVVIPSKMKGIEKKRQEKLKRRLAALREVLDDMATDLVPRDIPKRHEEIATRIADKLGEPFSWRALYRNPYRTAWRKVDDWLGRDKVDTVGKVRVLTRLSKAVLVHRLIRGTAKRDLLREKLRARLLAENFEGDWTPIA